MKRQKTDVLVPADRLRGIKKRPIDDWVRVSRCLPITDEIRTKAKVATRLLQGVSNVKIQQFFWAPVILDDCLAAHKFPPEKRQYMTLPNLPLLRILCPILLDRLAHTCFARKPRVCYAPSMARGCTSHAYRRTRPNSTTLSSAGAIPSRSRWPTSSPVI
jgi:hypothetical protein